VSDAGDAPDRPGPAATAAVLLRAAKELHSSLDLPAVLERLARAAKEILDADYAAVYRATGDGAVIEAAAGLPSELVGLRLESGAGLPGQVLRSGRSVLTNDPPASGGPSAHPFFASARGCLGAPLRWDGAIGGVVTVGYRRPFSLTEEHLGRLEDLTQLAATACTNASAHAALALVARTDGLTGCVNHAAMLDSLNQEIERAERSPAGALSLVMVDLDDFKSINERYGHLIGDEMLRRTGHALRQATRPYDVAARYGGDEFALVVVEAGEGEAEEIAQRALERIAVAVADLCEDEGAHATAGVAGWHPGLSPTELVARADRALLFGKHEGGRGQAIVAASVPDRFRPGRFARRPREGVPAPRPLPSPQAGEATQSDQRLRERARHLAAVNALGASMTGMTEPEAVLDTTARELCRMLDAASCTILRRTVGEELAHAAGVPLEVADLAARSLEEGRPLLAAHASARARLAAPLHVGGAPWGALEAVATGPGGFDEDHLQLAEAVIAHASAALHATQRYAALREAYDRAVS